MSETARRQLSVRLSVFVVAVCAVFLLIGGAADAEGPPAPATEYLVGTGDTLWEIAADHAGPDVDLRNLIADIKRMSDLGSSTIYPGQILLIPQT